MGVPFYFKSLISNYPDILTNKMNKNSNLFLDFNGIIHQSCYRTISEKNTTNHTIIFTDICNYLDELIKKYGPSKTYVCVDGIAPLAKIKQQRSRRFKSKMLFIKQSKIKSKYDVDVPDWDSNCITPGTQFMRELNVYLNNRYKNSTNIIISDSDEVGEGEHKIMDYIRNLPDEYEDIVIHGLDADLIMLSLMINRPRIFIFRDEKNEHNFLKVDLLREKIMDTINNKYSINENLKNGFIEDYICLCCLLGNDFLPKLASIDISQDGIDILLKQYFNTTDIIGENLIVDNKLNLVFLKRLISDLYITEESNIRSLYNYYNNKKYFCREKTPFERELNQLEFYPILNKQNQIDFNKNNWRVEYYKHYFNINYFKEEIFINKQIVYQYLYGLEWIFNYYKFGKYNNWYYPFYNSPLLINIDKYLSKLSHLPEYVDKYSNIKINNNIQLLLVLPKESHRFLPKKYCNISNNNNFKYLYCSEFKIDTNLCTFLHQAIAFLPNFNLDDLKNE